MNEASLYNLYSSANSTHNDVKTLEELIIKLHVLHLRLEHKMPMYMIAKRVGIRTNDVKLILHNNENN